MDKILVGVDFSESSLNAAKYAVKFAAFFSAKIVLIHAYSLPIPYSEAGAIFVTEDFEKTAINELQKVKVELTYTPAWTTDWLSQEAKTKLKKYGIAPPNHSSCTKLFSTAEVVICPQCNSKHTTLISRFGSTACKALYQCSDCKETFDLFKCH